MPVAGPRTLTKQDVERFIKVFNSALADASDRAERALKDGANGADRECRERITKEIEKEEAMAVDRVLQQASAEHKMWRGAAACFAQARAYKCTSSCGAQVRVEQVLEGWASAGVVTQMQEAKEAIRSTFGERYTAAMDTALDSRLQVLSLDEKVDIIPLSDSTDC